jgi:hypothetical protein
VTFLWMSELFICFGYKPELTAVVFRTKDTKCNRNLIRNVV